MEIKSSSSEKTKKTGNVSFDRVFDSVLVKKKEKRKKERNDSVFGYRFSNDSVLVKICLLQSGYSGASSGLRMSSICSLYWCVRACVSA